MTQQETHDQESSEPRLYKVLLMVLPVGVVVGTVVFMFMYFYLEDKEEQKRAVIASHAARSGDLEDMVLKFVERIGERDGETEQGRIGLRSAASMIEGRLGPQNVGYRVSKCEGVAAHGLLWKSLSVEIRGEKNPDEVVFAAVCFAGPGEDADANTVSTLMMLASAMALEKPARTIRFVFLPMALSAAEQNRWLVSRCLNSNESCVAIIGLHTMMSSPEAGQSAWQISPDRPESEEWWEALSMGQDARNPPRNEPAPSVWLSHPVFSSQTWQGKLNQRLQYTMEVIQEIRRWLLIVAG